MLTTAEKRRLRLSLPQSVTAEYTVDVGGTLETRSTTVDPTFRWGGSDMEGTENDEFDDYPVILLEWDLQGEEVPAETTLNDFTERIYDDDFDIDAYDADYVDPNFEDDTEAIIDLDEQKLEAELRITPVVEVTWQDGLPPQPRAEALARQCWRWAGFRARRELNNIGPNGERPMVVEQSSSPTPTRVASTYRTPMSASVRHTESFAEVVPVLQDSDGQVRDAENQGAKTNL